MISFLSFKNWVMQNHHLTSISTSPQFFARQIFYPAEGISGSTSKGSTKGARHIPTIGLTAGNSIIHTVTTSISILISEAY